jgi:hypothetical protein
LRIAYVLPVHRNGEQVARLIRRLATPHATFLVHVDARADAAVQERVAEGADGLPLTFLRRHRCHWGGMGIVRAALEGIHTLVARQVAFDYAALLSGQDYPLRAPTAIERFFAEADGRSFMSHFPLPRVDGWGDRGGLDRIEDWHLVGRRALHVRLPRPRRLPRGLEPFGGSAWWALSRPVVEHVERLVRERPEIVRFFGRALIPDELFFQTVVMSSPLAATVVDDNLHHVRWAGDARSPVTFTVADVEELFASEALFARKFDVTVDAGILDVLDARAQAAAA